MKSYHTTKGYYEFLAKYLLEETLPNEFPELKISDRPDLRLNDNVGVEVTQSSLSNDKYASAIFNDIKNKNIDTINNKKLEKFASLKCKPLIHKNKIYGYIQPATWVTTGPIKSAFEEKINKLEKYETEITHLFIYAPSFDDYDESDIGEFIKFAIGTQKSLQKKYSKIFIFQYSHLFVCDLIENKLKVLNLDKNMVHLCCVKAKKKNVKVLP